MSHWKGTSRRCDNAHEIYWWWSIRHPQTWKTTKSRSGKLYGCIRSAEPKIWLQHSFDARQECCYVHWKCKGILSSSISAIYVIYHFPQGFKEGCWGWSRSNCLWPILCQVSDIPNVDVHTWFRHLLCKASRSSSPLLTFPALSTKRVDVYYWS